MILTWAGNHVLTSGILKQTEIATVRALGKSLVYKIYRILEVWGKVSREFDF